MGEERVGKGFHGVKIAGTDGKRRDIAPDYGKEQAYNTQAQINMERSAESWSENTF